MTKEFNFMVMVCSQYAKEAAYEASGYLYTLLDTTPEYRSKASKWNNVKTLLRLLLPAPPWSGPPISNSFAISWGTVKRLLTGKMSIACLKRG